MDTKAQRKALFRSKLREAAQKQNKRIDSPLVRYNEAEQPVCRVCNVTLKSESLWPAHQASRKHHEAIKSVRASAAGLARANDTNFEPPAELNKPQSSSALPADFFDKQETKRQKNDLGAGNKIHSVSSQTSIVSVDSSLSHHLHGKKEVPSVVHSLEVPESVNKTNELASIHLVEAKGRNKSKPSSELGQPSKKMAGSDTKQVKGALPESFFDKKERSESQPSSQLIQPPRKIDGLEVKKIAGAPPDGFFDCKEKIEIEHSNQLSQPSKRLDGLEVKQVQGALPEGFFDNREADLRARGIEPIKVDINDAYKEFEKEIQEDLQEVDDRLEEEEIDAAEVREEFESLEQKAYRERVEMVKKQLLDIKAARLARGQKRPAFMGKESSDESSSDGDDDEENFAVDWRAKHL